jgi:hypothetical protein
MFSEDRRQTIRYSNLGNPKYEAGMLIIVTCSSDDRRMLD